MASTLDSVLLGPLYGSEPVRACFEDRAVVQSWLDAEAALAQAQALVGEVPPAAAERIREEAVASNFDLARLAEGIADTSHPLMPLIRALGERCGEHGAWVHWGATTQDIVDSGASLQLAAAAPPIRAHLVAAIRSAADLADRHAETVMPGRTHGQHAVPITFGLKAAVWTDELARACRRFDAAVRAACAGQLSGAAGTLATLPENGAAIRAEFCRILGLEEPQIVWHSSRDRLRDLAHSTVEIANAAERIGGEIVRHQATELAELTEPAAPGHVGSSTMPQKRNPFSAEYMIATARLLRGSASVLSGGTIHAFERDMSAWATEWLALPQCLILLGGIAEKLDFLLTGLEVDPERMAENLGITRNGIMAEAAMMARARQVGRNEAHEEVSAAARESAASGEDLFALLIRDRPDFASLEELTDARRQVGEAAAIVQRARRMAESIDSGDHADARPGSG